MKKLNKREIILGVVTGIFLLAFLVVQNVLRPLRDEGEDVDHRVLVNHTRLVRLQKIIVRGKETDDWYQAVSEAIGTTDNASKDLSALVSRIQIMASGQNIHVLQIQPQRIQEQDYFFLLPVHIELSGAWPDIVRFLGKVQASPEYLFINDLNFQKGGDDAGNLFGRVTLSGMKLKPVL